MTSPKANQQVYKHSNPNLVGDTDIQRMFLPISSRNGKIGTLVKSQECLDPLTLQ